MDAKKELVDREGILALLSDDEIARVSRADGETELIEGDEYVDLEEPSRGVLQVHSKIKPAKALPRSAVSDATWSKIIAQLG